VVGLARRVGLKRLGLMWCTGPVGWWCGRGVVAWQLRATKHAAAYRGLRRVVAARPAAGGGGQGCGGWWR
jgi:hypothetical protein